MDMSLLLAACAISLVGLPHGALDPVVAHRNGLIPTFKTAMIFFCGYLSMVGLVILIWVLVPILALTVFLLFSAVHFGRDWKQILGFGGLGYGAFVLGLPALLHAESVSAIFSFLTFGESAQLPLWTVLTLGIVSFVLIFLDLRYLNWLCWCELLFLTAAAFLTEPLWYFVIYFCALHSPKHLISELLYLKSEQRILAFVCVLAITIITLGLAAAFGAHLEIYYENINILIYQIIFIGLAALTVPHMCLLEWVAKHGR